MHVVKLTFLPHGPLPFATQHYNDKTDNKYKYTSSDAYGINNVVLTRWFISVWMSCTIWIQNIALQLYADILTCRIYNTVKHISDICIFIFYHSRKYHCVKVKILTFINFIIIIMYIWASIKKLIAAMAYQPSFREF